MVYFNWEGTTGTHRLAATWRSPAGGSSSTNAFDYTAPDRLFGAYWAIPISPASPTGTWTIDALVDGAPCGTFSFDIIDAEARLVAVARRPLTPTQMFEPSSAKNSPAPLLSASNSMSASARAFSASVRTSRMDAAGAG